jgi:transcriptional regulator NrdR family protein
MKCPKCSKPSEVVKVYQFPTEARRRRECTSCGLRFSTSERVWRRVYAEEVKGKTQVRLSRKVDHSERQKKTYSNFDVVALEGYDLDYEDVSTYVHASDD